MVNEEDEGELWWQEVRGRAKSMIGCRWMVIAVFWLAVVVQRPFPRSNHPVAGEIYASPPLKLSIYIGPYPAQIESKG